MPHKVIVVHIYAVLTGSESSAIMPNQRRKAVHCPFAVCELKNTALELVRLE
jgi:hypothetical protein